MEVSGRLHTTAALPQGNNPCYPLYERLDGLQIRSGHGGQDKNSQARNQIIQLVAQHHTIWALLALD